MDEIKERDKRERDRREGREREREVTYFPCMNYLFAQRNHLSLKSLLEYALNKPLHVQDGT